MEQIGLKDFYVIFDKMFSPPFATAINITSLSFDYKSNLVTLTAKQIS
jgi:hypothetical protein